MTAITVTEQRARKLSSELARFTAVVVEHMDPERIILFGSFATGEINDWSDLDLVVIAETGLPFFKRLKQVYMRVAPRVGMDILVYTPDEWEQLKTSRTFVREEIARKGKVVYERGRATVD